MSCLKCNEYACLVLWQLGNKSVCSGLWYASQLISWCQKIKESTIKEEWVFCWVLPEFMSQESSEGQQSSESSNITSGGSSSSSAKMVNFQIPPPDVARRNYSLPTKLDKEDDVHQVATLLALIGKDANKVFRTSTFSPPDDAEKIELVLSNSKSTTYPGRTPFMNGFFSLPGISVSPKLYIYIGQYLTELRQIVANRDLESITFD